MRFNSGFKGLIHQKVCWLHASPSVCSQVSTQAPLDGFYEICYWISLLQSIEKVQILLQSYKIIEHITCRSVCVRLYCWEQFIIFCSSTTIRRKPIVTFTMWQHSTVSAVLDRVMWLDNTKERTVAFWWQYFNCSLLRGTFTWTM